MPIVMISGMYQSGQEELAEAMVKKTGWPLLSRSELVDRAREEGIRIGRLELSIIRTPGFSERLAREKNLYLAFLTAAICERAGKGNLVYHGRAGHLLLPGLGHRVRVGLTIPNELRIQRTARALNLSLDKASGYLKQLDEDIEKWVKVIHRVDCNDTSQYDISLSLEHMSVSNAASVLCEVAELPDFRPTPLSTKLMGDTLLAAQARLRLAFDPRTGAADPQVRADDGVVTVTYSPREEAFAENVPEVLADLEGCRKIQCTMAETSILWVQERFDPGSESFQHITKLAQRWGAAVELLRLLPPDEQGAGAIPELTGFADGASATSTAHTETGGVEDDDPHAVDDDGGVDRAREELVSLGRSGGRHTAWGGHDKIVEVASADRNYSLVVIGNIFLAKGRSAQTRKTREMAMAVKSCLRAPVITTDELKTKVTFGASQVAKLVGGLALVVLIYFAAFHFQEPLLSLLGGPIHQHWRWLTPLVVVAVVPIIAHLYGTVAGLMLKLIDID